MWLSARTGLSFRKRQPNLEDSKRQDLDLIVTATLTMLALIIGFSLSMAVNRYDQRKTYEEAEANAIGMEYVRANLLPSAEASRVRVLLKEYLNQRILFYRTRGDRQLLEINAHTARLQSELWSLVEAPAAAQQTPVPCSSRFRHERCTELAGIHTSHLVEPHPTWGLASNICGCHLLKSSGRLWCTLHGGGCYLL
jgi:hypothetical protein